MTNPASSPCAERRAASASTMSVTGIIRRSLPLAPILHRHDPHAGPGGLQLLGERSVGVDQAHRGAQGHDRDVRGLGHGAKPRISPSMTRPVALVTNVVSPYRREPFRLLAERQGAEVIAWEAASAPVPGLAVHRTSQAGAARLAGSGRYRAVVCGLGGRIALPATYAATRRAGVPFVLWAGIWAHPRSPAHALSWPATRRLYRHADAVVTYGPHVSRYVERFRDRGNVFEAPQAVDVGHFGAPVPEAERAAARERAGGPGTELLALFVGRLEREKGVDVLLEAWRRAGLGPGARLALAGSGPLEAAVARSGDRHPGPRVRSRARAAGAVRGRRPARPALGAHRNFPGALGVGRKRGHVAKHTSHRQRRRRRSRRGTCARRPQRPLLPGRGRGGARIPPAARLPPRTR